MWIFASLYCFIVQTFKDTCTLSLTQLKLSVKAGGVKVLALHMLLFVSPCK